jgi:two-component system chemotaxis sensor kinase CheA
MFETESEIDDPELLELLGEFLQEAREGIAEVEPVLLDLERSGAQNTVEVANRAFRFFHSLKGTAAFLGLEHVCRVTHAAESLLGRYRDGSSGPLGVAEVQLMLNAVDVIRIMLDQVEIDRTDAGTATAVDRLVTRLTAAVEQSGVKPPPVAVFSPPPALEEEAAGPATAPMSPPPAPAHPIDEHDEPATAANRSQGTNQASSLRVDVGKLDQLMNLVGELIIAETMVTRSPDVQGVGFTGFQKSSLHLRRVTRALQDVAMSLRMVPIGATFRKMMRLVRDVSARLDKKVALHIEGEDTEVDKTVAEQISDPLVHLLRNALDHGIEMPDARAASGKPPEATLRLTAAHRAGEVWITVEDDGRGLNRERILAKGIERGLVDPDRGELSDSEVFDLLFQPGFSTAAAVTELSGRGVGLDVVRKNVESMRGRVEVTTRPGQGTTFIIRIPLTLAIFDGMIVRVGEVLYTIPLRSMRESIRPDRRALVQLPDGAELIRVRQRHFPVLRLHRMHGVPGAVEDPCLGILLMVEDGDQTACILVDEVMGQQQTVVKGLPAGVNTGAGITGCTIMGNGEISFIVDVGSMLAATRARPTAVAVA